MKQKQFSQFVFFNGKLYKIRAYKLLTLENLLSFFSFQKGSMVLEYNGKVLRAHHWPSLKLKQNDKIETITIVGGG